MSGPGPVDFAGPSAILGSIRSVFQSNFARLWTMPATGSRTRLIRRTKIAVRLHHRLVAIHPFPNGNGRTTRLVADILAVRLGQEPFTWGLVALTDASETRRRYIAALIAADNHDIRPLLEFARS